jgi:hypothetical protein
VFCFDCPKTPNKQTGDAGRTKNNRQHQQRRAAEWIEKKEKQKTQTHSPQCGIKKGCQDWVNKDKGFVCQDE